MPGIRRILVAIKDPNAKSSPALSKAAQLAHSLNAELILFHAIAAPLYLDEDATLLGDGLAGIERSGREDCMSRLETIARKLRHRLTSVAVSAKWDYPAYEAIVREATRVKADLIVAERHHGWHTPRSLLRLTDWELLRFSPVPVLLVKTTGVYRRPTVLAAVDPDHTCAKPLRLDGRILDIGLRLASALHGRLHAVHAFVPVPVAAYAGGTSEEKLRRLRTEAARAAREKLREVTRPFSVAKSGLHVIGRHPADAIEECAAETHSSIVVMGAISRHGLKRLLFGNTAEKVLDQLTCDVLVVKPAHLLKPLPHTPRGARYLHALDPYVLK